jgi:hypothetical protein
MIVCTLRGSSEKLSLSNTLNCKYEVELTLRSRRNTYHHDCVSICVRNMSFGMSGMIG